MFASHVWVLNNTGRAAVDGTRLGAKEVLLVAVYGRDSDGHGRACWAPPQVRASVCCADAAI